MVFRKESLDVVETSDLELLRLLFDDLAMKGVHQRRRVEQERAVRKINFTLTNRRQVVFGEGSLKKRRTVTIRRLTKE